jgi:hypothetical protein
MVAVEIPFAIIPGAHTAVHPVNNNEIELLNFEHILVNKPTSSGMSSTI